MTVPSESDLRQALQRFGHPNFRTLQLETIQAVLAGRDALTVLPTGGGKSLTYQLPATLLPGTTIVVSPLIALMKDQVDALERKGDVLGRDLTIEWRAELDALLELERVRQTVS